MFRPDGASRGSLDSPHTVQVVLVWSRVARRQDTTRRLVLDGAPTLSWREERRQTNWRIKEVSNEQKCKNKISTSSSAF